MTRGYYKRITTSRNEGLLHILLSITATFLMQTNDNFAFLKDTF